MDSTAPNQLFNSSPDFFIYPIKPGDSLSSIVASHYGILPRHTQRHQNTLRILQYYNPKISHVDRIYAGETVLLPTIDELEMGTCRAEDFFDQLPAVSSNPYTSTISAYFPKTPEEQEAFHLLTMLQENSNFLTVPGSILLGGTSALLSPANLEFKSKLASVYTHYKNGALSKNQYDYQRRKILKSLTENLGPFEKTLFKGKSAAQSLRIVRKGGIPATANIAQHASRLSKLARYASKGGVVLTGVGVAAGCMQIASAQTRKEKNEIFVETTASTITGLAAGFIITAVMVTTPVGWGVALVLAAGSAALSWGAGKGSAIIYDKNLSQYDLVSASNLDAICS